MWDTLNFRIKVRFFRLFVLCKSVSMKETGKHFLCIFTFYEEKYMLWISGRCSVGVKQHARRDSLNLQWFCILCVWGPDSWNRIPFFSRIHQESEITNIIYIILSEMEYAIVACSTFFHQIKRKFISCWQMMSDILLLKWVFFCSSIPLS